MDRSPREITGCSPKKKLARTFRPNYLMMAPSYQCNHSLT